MYFWRLSFRPGGLASRSLRRERIVSHPHAGCIPKLSSQPSTGDATAAASRVARQYAIFTLPHDTNPAACYDHNPKTNCRAS
jgi:hypothetical protein